MRNFFAILAMLSPFAAHAVVATTSRVAPIGVDGAWSGVGQMSGASAVAIGPRTLLTAAHVDAGDFFLAGKQYHMVSTALAPIVSKSTVDLRIVQVAETLPTWYSVATKVKKGATVTMVGFGNTGVVENGGTGYEATPDAGRRAGTNTISSLDKTSGRGPTMKAMLKKAGEAVLMSGDSGGGWFVNGQLVGISDFTFSNKKSLPDFGFAKKAYFGSGAVDVTNKTIRAWLAGQVASSSAQSISFGGGSVQAVPEPGTFVALALARVPSCGGDEGRGKRERVDEGRRVAHFRSSQRRQWSIVNRRS